MPLCAENRHIMFPAHFRCSLTYVCIAFQCKFSHQINTYFMFVFFVGYKVFDCTRQQRRIVVVQSNSAGHDITTASVYDHWMLSIRDTH
jgi:hypothetical protein